MKFFVTLISLAKRNLFSPWMLHIFTVIPNDEGLRALKHFSDQRTVEEPSSEVLLRLAELVLAFNCFSFCGNYHNQTNGVAMGTKILIQVGQSFRRFYRTPIFSQHHGPKPELYGRYIDDCIGATSSSREELTQFITAVNSFYPTRNYACEISDTSLAFLDIKISNLGNGLCTTDSHNYLLYPSSHPSHEKRSMSFSQFNENSSFI